MRVLLIGSGGREHALAKAIAASPRLARLWVAPGNSGTAEIAENLDLDINDHMNIVDFCQANNIDLVVIGPDQPLADGLADILEAGGFKVFGPSKAAARIEGSKAFAKDLCDRARIPTARYRCFHDEDAALDYVDDIGAPIVIKADGLALGKGVTVAQTLDEARAAIRQCFSGAFGAAGARIVIEEKLEGEEVSFFALCDGTRAAAFASAQDHKRVGEGDVGPNTGGMGAYSPAPIVTPEMEAQIMERFVTPAIAQLAEDGSPFKGVLFVGLMIGKDGPKLIEYNARFGDPETQAILPRLDADVLPLLDDCARGRLAPLKIPFKDQAALCVVLATKGYPGKLEQGGEIKGVETAQKLPGVVVTHAGAKRNEDGRLIAAGGRALNVTGLGESVRQAAERAYTGVDAIDWPQGFCRRDIGWRALRSAH